MNCLHLINGRTVRQYLSCNRASTIEVVKSAYRAHWQGRSICPESLFLRLPGRNRIIALPSYVSVDDEAAVGLKWISSFPENIRNGTPRASALVVLNDIVTGLPQVLMDGAPISSARTAAFAALATCSLLSETKLNVSVIGCGLIAAETLEYIGSVISVGRVRAFDIDSDRALAFISRSCVAPWGSVATSIEDALRGSDLAIFATTASEPYVLNWDIISHCKLVLHISLRDLGEKVIARCFNVTDDEQHVLRELTSLHRLALAHPEANAVDTTLGSILWGNAVVPHGRPIAFSPFGLGVLDIVLANHVYKAALDAGDISIIQNFF